MIVRRIQTADNLIALFGRLPVRRGSIALFSVSMELAAA
jgi:hypothetical protein